MQVKRSSTLPKTGTAFDWSRRETEVSDLADLASVADNLDQPCPPRNRVVRWQELPASTLVTLAQAGHMDAFDPLYRRFSPQLVATARRRLDGEYAKADDVVSEAWMAAMASIDRFTVHQDAELEFTRWLFGILRRCVAAAFRGSHEIPTDTMDLHDNEHAYRLIGIGHADVEDERADKPKQVELLHTAIAALSPQRQQVVAYRLAGKTLPEIANVTGQTLAHVSSLWARTRDALRTALVSEYDPIDSATPEQLQTALESLTGRQRTVAKMHLDGLSYGEISRRIGVPKGRVASTWADAHQALWRLLLNPAASGCGRSEQANQRRAALRDIEVTRIREAAQELADKQRTVVLLRLEGKSYSQVAAVVGGTASGAQNSWERARARFIRDGLMAA